MCCGVPGDVRGSFRYGDTVTLEDMTGRKQKQRRARSRGTTSRSTLQTAGTTSAAALGGGGGGGGGGPGEGGGEGTVRFDATLASEQGGATTGHGAGRSSSRGRGGRTSKHAPFDKTSHTNPEFVRMQKERAAKTVDFIMLNKTAFPTHSSGSGSGSGGGRAKIRSVDVEGKEPPGGEVFNYSGQRRNYAEWQKQLMRERLAKDKASTYTYSKDFQSLTVCLVNEAEVELQEKKAARARWTTQRGFVYPAPRDPSEFRRHPKAPSASRKEVRG